MRLIFLGTGGGRFVMAKQLRRTAGFVIRTSEKTIHVDPGPGALVYFNKTLGDPRKIDAIFVSHAHLDHSNDLAPLVEGMADGGRKPKGVVVGSRYTIEGGEDYVPQISEYHRSMVERVIVTEPDMEFRIGDLRVRTTPTMHNEPTGTGFLFDDGKTKVAYLSDTGYTEDLGRILEEETPEVIIFNIIFDGEQRTEHTNLDTVRSVLKITKPKLILLQHFGARITVRHMENAIARRIERESGVETIALRDGDVVDISEWINREKTLEDFI